MSCLPQLETCTECVARATLSLPPLEGRATLAAVGLWASAAMHGVMVLLAAAQIATGQPGEEGLLVIADAFVAVLYLAVFITTIVLVCRWFHLATRYGLARSVSLDVSTPASAQICAMNSR